MNDKTNKIKNIYNAEFYKGQAKGSYVSAKKVVDLFCDNLFLPKSIMDVGCGVGTWLKAWKEKGVKSILGLDGNEVDDGFLYIPRNKIKVVNLNNIINEKLEKVDLVSTLEVAEHLDSKSSEDFIKKLTSLSNIVLFSAALPHQPGLNHINCKPLQFWVDLFSKFGFECFDIMRPLLLNNSDGVACWYIQNIIIFARGDKKDFLITKGYKPVLNPVQFYHSDLIEPVFKHYENCMLRKKSPFRFLVNFGCIFIPNKKLRHKIRN